MQACMPPGFSATAERSRVYMSPTFSAMEPSIDSARPAGAATRRMDCARVTILLCPLEGTVAMGTCARNKHEAIRARGGGDIGITTTGGERDRMRRAEPQLGRDNNSKEGGGGDSRQRLCGHRKGTVNQTQAQGSRSGSRSGSIYTGWVHALTGSSKVSSSSSLPPPAAIVMGRSTNPLCST